MKKKEDPVYLLQEARNGLYVAELGHTTQAVYGRRFTEKEAEKYLRKHPEGYEKILVREWEEGHL
ncbi:MAG: hypothetical protein M0P61_00255 [Ignavibacteriaceae bacterium]|nr:hypothetical protein [Ignavibacteriaceae bacterium]